MKKNTIDAGTPEGAKHKKMVAVPAPGRPGKIHVRVVDQTELDRLLEDDLLVVVERGHVIAALEQHPLDRTAIVRLQEVGLRGLDHMVVRRGEQQQRLTSCAGREFSGIMGLWEK